MRTVTFTGDSASLDFVPTITIPAAEAGSLSALNVARVGPVAQGGVLQNDKVLFLPAARDASGNMVVRDIYLRGAARVTPVSVAPTSAGRAKLGIIKMLRSAYTFSTYQGQINWAIEPELRQDGPDELCPQAQEALHVFTIAAGRDPAKADPERDRPGPRAQRGPKGPVSGLPSIAAPWLMEAKRDTWTLLYDNFQSFDKDTLDCTAFYEYIYLTYRPVFGGPGSPWARIWRA